jgi:hypothetical protein
MNVAGQDQIGSPRNIFVEIRRIVHHKDIKSRVGFPQNLINKGFFEKKALILGIKLFA